MKKKIIGGILLILILLGGTFLYLKYYRGWVRDNIQEEYSESIKLAKIDYEKNLESINNKKLTKEKARKEKKELIIKYIRDLGFKVDEENHTVSPLIFVNQESLFFYGYSYIFKVLKAESLIKLNNLSSKPYLLRLENPLGLDFIVDYKDMIRKKEGLIHGENRNIISLENTYKIPSSIRLSYYGRSFKSYIWLNKNKYMPDLDFRYETIYNHQEKKRLDGLVNLRVDLDPLTGKKIYVRTVMDL